MTDFLQSVWPQVTQSHLIIATFAIFVATILLFGIVHYRLYRRRPSRFWIASELARKQAEDTISKLQHEIDILTAEIDAIVEVRQAVAEGDLKELPARLPSGRRVNGGAYQGRLPDGNIEDTVWLSVVAKDGSFLCRLEDYEYHELTPSFLSEWLGEKLAHRQQWRADRERRIRELETNPQGSLRFWDFIYFSGISQTTVGNGDILPNATGIRILVLAQILVGYALFIVLLNLVLIG